MTPEAFAETVRLDLRYTSRRRTHFETSTASTVRTGQENGAKELATESESNGLPARIPTSVVFEVCYGIEGADDPEAMLPRYGALFANQPRAELTEPVARRGGRLYARHETSDEKRRLDLVDAMVAATGLALDEAVVTNGGAYQDVDGLAVRGAT